MNRYLAIDMPNGHTFIRDRETGLQTSAPTGIVQTLVARTSRDAAYAAILRSDAFPKRSLT